MSSVIMGSTPEFELALFTMCFLGGQEENIVWLDNYELKIKAYRIRSKYGGESAASVPSFRPMALPASCNADDSGGTLANTAFTECRVGDESSLGDGVTLLSHR